MVRSIVVLAFAALALFATMVRGGSDTECAYEVSDARIKMQEAAMIAIFSYQPVVCSSTFTVYAYVFCCGVQPVGTAVGVDNSGLASVFYARCEVSKRKRSVELVRYIANATSEQVEEAQRAVRRDNSSMGSYTPSLPGGSSSLPGGSSGASPTSPCRVATPLDDWTKTTPSVPLPTFHPASFPNDAWDPQPPGSPSGMFPPTWSNPAGNPACSGCIPPHRATSVWQGNVTSFDCKALQAYLKCIGTAPCAAPGAAPYSGTSDSTAPCEECEGTYRECTGLEFLKTDSSTTATGGTATGGTATGGTATGGTATGGTTTGGTTTSWLGKYVNRKTGAKNSYVVDYENLILRSRKRERADVV